MFSNSHINDGPHNDIISKNYYYFKEESIPFEILNKNSKFLFFILFF